MSSDQPKPQPDLTEDPAALKQMVRELTQHIQEQNSRIQDLTHKLDLLLRRTFGHRAETVDENQLRLAFAELARESEESALPVPPMEAENLLGPPPESGVSFRP